MLNKKAQSGFVIAIVILIVIVAVGVYFYVSGNGFGGDKGRVVFAITDAAADVGSVSQVLVTVDNVEAHKVEGDSWVTISSNAQTYDLLELKQSGELAIVADIEVQTGTYDQVRFEISKVVVVDSNGENEAKLPSDVLRINSDLEVNENSTATATFDFIVDESLHITGNGRYILAPVIQVETRSDAEVEVQRDDRVTIEGGEVKTNVKVGMDENGNVDIGLKIPANANLDIGSDNKIKIGLGGESNTGVGVGGNVGVGIGLGGEETQRYSIVADDNGFYMQGNEISSITVAKNKPVLVTFLVDEDNVYYAGLDFRGCGEETGKVNPGDSIDFEFTTSSDCIIRSFWPATERLKATLQVRSM